MHLNTHTGRNVHTCPYCNIQFISRQSYESHVKIHSNEDLKSEDNGPQIVSVKSIPSFENETHEEIQIEPDIIDENEQVTNLITLTQPEALQNMHKYVENYMFLLTPEVAFIKIT